MNTGRQERLSLPLSQPRSLLFDFGHIRRLESVPLHVSLAYTVCRSSGAAVMKGDAAKTPKHCSYRNVLCAQIKQAESGLFVVYG